MAEAEEEIKRPKQEGSKDLNEPEDIKTASESTSIRCCRINSNFSGRVCWSNLELDSLLEPQEEAKEDGTRIEDGKTKRAEKDMLIDTIKKDQTGLKDEAENLLAESEKVVEQLKGKMQRQKEFERRLYDSFVTQTSQLEQAHIFIDKWKQKMSAASDGTGITSTSYEENYWLRLQVERLENELGIQRNGQNPWEEVKRLRKELELAIEAEENSKSAMDDLAAVIKEVAAEANRAKEKLASTEQQLQMMKEETETLRSMINIKEKAHESLKATINRLRIELNGKETEFVDSIKKAEEEKVNMQEENARLLESLNEAKDESRKIRDILKQAKVEIAQLKDSLAVVALTQETERLRKNESKADENTKAAEKEQRKNGKESCSEKGSRGGGKSTRDSKGSGKSSGQLKGRGRSTEDLKSCGKAAGSFCSIPLHVPGLPSRQRGVEEVHETDDSLTGSIFDIVQPASVELHHTRSASAVTLTDDEISFNSEDFDNSERLYADDMEIEKEPHPKKKVLLKKFSELWRRKNHTHSQSHNHNQNQNEVAIE